MADWVNETPRIKAHGFQQDKGVHVTKAVWCGDQCAFALGDGTIQFATIDGLQKTVTAHEGACLAAAPLEGAIVTCSDDGKVISTTHDGTIKTHLDQMGRFFDQIATAPWGGIAVADGRRIYVLMGDGVTREYKASGSVGGLAFAPKGRKLAASRNNGASVYWVGTERDTPDEYEWQGAHGPITWNGRGDFIVTSMQENALHIWRTDKKKHGRMGGYPTRIKSFSWDPNGISLATSGADGVIIWPFGSKDGPIGKGAEQISIQTEEIASTVAWHPSRDLIAFGTDAGNIAVVRRDGAINAVATTLGSAVTTLEWADKGKALAFGCDEGALGVVDFSQFG